MSEEGKHLLFFMGGYDHGMLRMVPNHSYFIQFESLTTCKIGDFGDAPIIDTLKPQTYSRKKFCREYGKSVFPWKEPIVKTYFVMVHDSVPSHAMEDMLRNSWIESEELRKNPYYAGMFDF